MRGPVELDDVVVANEKVLTMPGQGQPRPLLERRGDGAAETGQDILAVKLIVQT